MRMPRNQGMGLDLTGVASWLLVLRGAASSNHSFNRTGYRACRQTPANSSIALPSRVPLLPRKAFMLTLVLIYAVVMVLPIKLASDFADGRRTGVITCALASAIAPFLAVLAYRVLGGGVSGFMLSYVALISTYVFMLRIPSGRVIGFALIVLALQIASVFAVISLGYNVAKILLV